MGYSHFGRDFGKVFYQGGDEKERVLLLLLVSLSMGLFGVLDVQVLKTLRKYIPN